MKKITSDFTAYPADMCESCIYEIDNLITSGELSEANDRLNEYCEEGTDCRYCIANSIGEGSY